MQEIQEEFKRVKKSYMLSINHNTLFPFCSLCVNFCAVSVLLYSVIASFSVPQSACQKELWENQSKCRLGEAEGSRAGIPQLRSRGLIIWPAMWSVAMNLVMVLLFSGSGCPG